MTPSETPGLMTALPQPLPITLWDVIEQTLNRPEAFFTQLRDDYLADPQRRSRLLWQTAGIVTGVLLLQAMADPHSTDVNSLVTAAVLSVISGLLIWLANASLTALAAFIFTRQSHFALFLVLSGLSALPGLMVPPVAVLRHTGIGGLQVLAWLGQSIIWLWGTFLFILAYRVSYRLSWLQIILLVVLPSLLALLIGGYLLMGVINNTLEKVFIFG